MDGLGWGLLPAKQGAVFVPVNRHCVSLRRRLGVHSSRRLLSRPQYPRFPVGLNPPRDGPAPPSAPELLLIAQSNEHKRRRVSKSRPSSPSRWLVGRNTEPRRVAGEASVSSFPGDPGLRVSGTHIFLPVFVCTGDQVYAMGKGPGSISHRNLGLLLFLGMLASSTAELPISHRTNGLSGSARGRPLLLAASTTCFA